MTQIFQPKINLVQNNALGIVFASISFTILKVPTNIILNHFRTHQAGHKPRNHWQPNKNLKLGISF